MQDDFITQTETRRTLRQRIMRRVYLLYMLRNLAPLAFDCVIFVITVFFVTVFVSVRDVLSNFGAASTGSNMLQFSVAAITGTKLKTKFLLLVLGVVGFFAVRHLKKAVRAVRTLRKGTEQKQSETNTERVGTRDI